MLYVKNVSGERLLLRDLEKNIEICLLPDEQKDLSQFAPVPVLMDSKVIQAACREGMIKCLTKKEIKEADSDEDKEKKSGGRLRRKGKE